MGPTCTTNINSQDSHIQFTKGEPNQEGGLPFLDTLVSSGPNNRLVTSVYRKPTHTLTTWTVTISSQQKNVFNTLASRAKVVCTSQQALQKEMEHINKALQACNFPPWAINTLHNKFNCKTTVTMDTETTQQPKQTTTTVDLTTKTFLLWYLTSMDWGKV